ncbi:MAG: peptide chain release factor N(5)-glutamine methyltransferase [Proteobacteria bacterium]|nr:peptide chain release factor N(5)-glutamine methyltransferase [Pseudomonadota bacterium]
MKMNRSALIKWGKECLESRGIAEPGAEAELLFLFSGNIGRTELYRHPEVTVPPKEEERYRELIRRREERIPLFYLLGEREFWSIPIQVAPGVLIPRPETELLVEEALKIARSREQGAGSRNPNPESNISLSDSSIVIRQSSICFLDLGTGSGAVALALLTEIPEARAWATDLSPDALRIAAGNARRLKLEDRIQFLAGDLFNPLRQFREFFHLVVCNPPYIPSAVIPTLAPEVARGEPRLALDGGEDGLQVIRRVAEEAFAYLQTPGFLLMEIGDTQAEAVRDLLARQERYQDIRVIQDYSGRDRVVIAEKKGHRS